MKIRNIDIGSGLIMAPLAGMTSLPFRLLARENGADLVFTEMISSVALVRNPRRNAEYVRSSEAERPVGAQIFGSRPEEMAQAASMITGMSFDLIDINMGCPVKKIIKSGSGAALLRDLDHAFKLIHAVVQATTLPVTIKMRSGWDSENLCAVDLARAAEEAGVSALTLHPRTKAQGFGGKADWEMIGRVKDAVTIPVIGNGDIRTPEDAERMLRETGCDGLMIGRAALGNPWIFKRIRARLFDGQETGRPGHHEIRKTLLCHLKREVDCFGEKRGVLRMRKFAAWYSRGLPGAAEFRKQVNRQVNEEEFKRIVDRYFQFLSKERAAEQVG